MSDVPTLVDWAGGPPKIAAMINAFYDRVEQDEVLSPFFPGGVHEEHRRNVATWWSEVFGGPKAYTEQLGGYWSGARFEDLPPAVREWVGWLLEKAPADRPQSAGDGGQVPSEGQDVPPMAVLMEQGADAHRIPRNKCRFEHREPAVGTSPGLLPVA